MSDDAYERLKRALASLEVAKRHQDEARDELERASEELRQAELRLAAASAERQRSNREPISPGG
jgi:hypothetical protein